MNRRSTPDILSALMGGAVKQESNKEIKHENVNALKKESNKKEKTTFNLSKAILGLLEDSWIEIRKLRGDKKISKTDIVESALKEAIEEFQLHKESSKFYSKLESNKTINNPWRPQ